MSQSFKVFVVDDDPVVLEIIRTILEPDCQIQTFGSAEDCLAQLAAEKPDLFLLDISLPGMDGYSLCRQLKEDSALRQTPVIFVSGHDTIEERIRGYDAGGMDFIVKPFEPEELLRKLQVAQSMVLNQRSLAGQLEDAEYLSTLVMASMDETGILLQFMSKLIAMESAEEIAAGLLELMQRFKLDGVVQTRVGSDTQTISTAGKNLPLEVAVIEHVRNQGRIFEFRRRSVHNFEHITLMVNNLPLEDPDYCGRLRDHLSVAAQGVDSRLVALQTEEANKRSQAGILSALDSVGNTIMELREAHQDNSEASSKLIVDLQESLLNSFYRLGLTDNQEKFLQDLVGDFMTQMAELLNRGAETQEALQRLNNQLGQLRSN
ncbi:response regulator [Propionivibrio sp.]|uniref:response regulator n=1 Tax=Propionivibrio sp. TaxID=2212460 RepID=UPI003BF042E1